MKIITQLETIARCLQFKPHSLFSNLFKDSQLQFQDLVSLSTLPSRQPSSFNITPKRFNAPISTSIPTAQEAAARKLQTLEFIERSIAKTGQHKEARVRFESEGLNEEERGDNAGMLMKYLDHILDKNTALQVVRMVEKYCRFRRSSDKHMAAVLNSMASRFSSNHDSKDQANLFKSVNDFLVHNLNYYSQNIQTNSQLIDSLLQLLAKSDPFQITTVNYLHGAISVEEEDSSVESQGSGQVMVESVEGEKFFQEEHDDKGKETAKYKQALEEAFRLRDRTKFSKLHLKHPTEVEEVKKEQKLRIASEKIFFHKKVNKLVKNTGPKEDDLRSAYIYELPFTITDNQAQQLILFLQSSKGIKVESYALFPYKTFIEKQHLDVVFRVPERFTDKNVRMERIVTQVDIGEFTSPSANKKGKQRSKKSQFDSVPLQNQPHRRKSVTEALLLKIKKESYSKFNKSSMLIKFASIQDKQAVLSPESRLYGVNYKHFKNIKIQQGYCKTSVTLIGIPWGCSSKELEKHLNQALSPERLFIKVQQNCILTKSSIVIQFQHLSQAILAIQRLNNLSFQNKSLRAHLSYGSCKVHNSQYNSTVEQSYGKLKQKIGQCAALYSKRYEQEQLKSIK